MEIVVNQPQREELKVGTVTFRPLYGFRLTENDLKVARLELGETEEKKAASLLALEKLIRDKDLRYRLDDEYLVRFLRYRKYDVKKAYAAIRKFYEFRKDTSYLFDIPPNLDFFLRRGILRYLPYRDEGSIIFWVDTNEWNIDEMSWWEVLTAALAIVDIFSMDPSMQIHGLVGIWDVGGFTTRHAVRCVYPTAIRTFLACMQSIYPWRVKRMIVLNCHPLARGIYNTFRYRLSKKIADRIILLGSDTAELHRYLNPRILPKKYGGCIETSECCLASHVMDNIPYIEYERSFGKVDPKA